MKIHIGFEMIYDCPKPTPMIFNLNVHFTRVSDLVSRDDLMFDPPVPRMAYRDSFGNWCTRIVAPQGRIRISADAIVNDSGIPDLLSPHAQQLAVQDLPEEPLLFLLGSRYCETDRLSPIAWQLFEHAPTGWGRVQAICDYVHLAVAFCRCMNIPARYCTGYLGDIGTPPPYGTMDFAAWFEVFLDGSWHTFDARNNTPRIGRVLIARGRDAADVALNNTFGPNTLSKFKVWTDEIS